MNVSSLQNCHIIMVGNPGVGKSTILNSIIGRAEFPSGMTFGSGLTTALNTRVIDGVTYSDTPGLDDVEIRDQAAAEISKALQRGGTTKLVFVVTTEDGRVRTVDLFTMKVILEAIERAGVDPNNKFSIMVNKCDDEFLTMLEENPQGKRVFERILGKVKDVSLIGYMKVDSLAKGKQNVLLNPSSQYVDFVARAPYIVLPQGNTVRLDVRRWEERLLNFAKRLKEIIAETMHELQSGFDSIFRTAFSIIFS